MKAKIFLFSALFFLFSCKKEPQIFTENQVVISERVQFQKNAGFLEVKSGKFTYKIPKEKLPYKNVMLLNSSLTGYILELEKEEVIKGISSPEYVYSEKIHQMLEKNIIQNIGNEQKYDIEKIIAYKPDVIFTNYIQSFDNTYDVLKKNGIEIIFIDEYLEQQPLQKSRIIELFGVLLGGEKKAEEVYKNVEKNYLELKKTASKTKNRPVVIANEMYGSQWFLPGGKTYAANYFRDANADYILNDNQDEKSIPLTFEEVFLKAGNAQYWMNLSDYSNRKQMLPINPNYEKMNVFKHGKLYSIHGKTRGSGNDVFESGAVRADLVLKDYIKAFHPELFADEPFIYLKEIQ
ncbi:MAG: ABC transporter substrate-binding protein [Bergeyella sp.]